MGYAMKEVKGQGLFKVLCKGQHWYMQVTSKINETSAKTEKYNTRGILSPFAPIEVQVLFVMWMTHIL